LPSLWRKRKLFRVWESEVEEGINTRIVWQRRRFRNRTKEGMKEENW